MLMFRAALNLLRDKFPEGDWNTEYEALGHSVCEFGKTHGEKSFDEG